MKFLESIKKYFSTQEAPYNWGASIEKLRVIQNNNFDMLLNLIKELEQRQASYFDSVVSPLGNKLDHNAAFFSDQMHAYEESYRVSMFILQDKISKLEKDVKKLKAKPKKAS